MSINHYSSDQIPESRLFWSSYMMNSSSPSHTSGLNSRFARKPTNHWSANENFDRYPSSSVAGGGSAAMFDLNNEEDEEQVAGEHMAATPAYDAEGNYASMDSGRQMEMLPKEPLFEKPLTPSDVGKLNRLVIPKQHAEKYFPMSGGGGGVSGENGFLLSFEDEMRKAWRFRYSYWNSSQSYVLTKGWSRFVKEKRLDAGDLVLFSRHRLDSNRLLIGWRRRNSGLESGGGHDRGTTFYHVGGNAHPNQLHDCSYNSYQPEYCDHAGGGSSASGSSCKTLRLFGVNLECQAVAAADESPPTHTACSVVMSAGQAVESNHHRRRQSQTESIPPDDTYEGKFIER